MANYPRRYFLRTLSLASAATLLLPYCTSSNETQRKLQFAGQLRGEKHLVGHKLRDRLLTIPTLEPEGPLHDVLIAGAGLSGLSIAHWLHKGGVKEIVLIEKEDVAGGLCRGETTNNLDYACGAHYMDYPEPGAHAVAELFADCGLLQGTDPEGWPIVLPQHVLRGEKHQLFTNGTWEPYDYPVSIAQEEDLAELHRFETHMQELSAWRDTKGRPAFGLPLSALSDDDFVRQLDNVSMLQYLQQEGFRSELLHWYCSIWIVDEFGVSLHECSAWAGLQFFRQRPQPQGFVTGSVSFGKGLGYLSEKLLHSLPENCLRTQHWVVSMRNENSRVLSTLYDEANDRFYCLQSRQAVFALPKTQVYHLVPELLGAGRTEFRNLHYAPWLVANIHVSQQPDYGEAQLKWDNTIYQSFTMGYINNHQTMRRPPKPEEPHIFTLYACFPDDLLQNRQQMLNLGWEHWANVVLRELQKAHPEIETIITQLDIWLWGHPMRQPRVGTVWGEQRQLMQRPQGHIHFSHVDICGLPVAEEAIEAAYRTARTLIAALA